MRNFFRGKRLFPRKFFFLFSAIVLFSGATNVVQAHGVWIFAYESGSEIVVEGNFGNGRPVSGGDVQVFSPQADKPFIVGKTDKQGIFRFPRPDNMRLGAELRLVLNAGSGHAAEWKFVSESATQLSDRQAAEKNFADDVPDKGKGVQAVSLDKRQLEELVTRVVAREVEPLKRMLYEDLHRGPSMSEIIGGIGWLVGLAGLLLYVKNKKR